MADEPHYHHHDTKPDVSCEAAPAVEASDRGLFDFMGKKDQDEKKCESEAALASDFGEKVQVSEEDKEKKHGGLLEKLHRSSSSSSSSSCEEEVGEDGEKKKKKKKKKKGLKEKLSGETEDTSVPIEKCEETAPTHGTEEKKGFLDKIKEKLPGGKKTEEVPVVAPPPQPAGECHSTPEAEGEKKGFLEKIKEKIPGFHSKTEEEKEKEKEKEKECH